MNNKKLFKSKEHYLAFRKAWATSVNSKENKRTGDKRVDAAHHMLYNILRDKPFYNGFSVISNSNKLMNGMYFLQSLVQTHIKLSHIKYLTTLDYLNNINEKYVNNFLEIFEGLIDKDFLKHVQIPELIFLPTQFMEEMKHKISTGEIRTCNDFFNELKNMESNNEKN